MPASRALLIELEELGLDPSVAYTLADLVEHRRRRRKRDEWILVARGSSRITDSGQVVNEVEEVDDGLDDLDEAGDPDERPSPTERSEG